jgi:hypothetical protein
MSIILHNGKPLMLFAATRIICEAASGAACEMLAQKKRLEVFVLITFLGDSISVLRIKFYTPK